MLADSFLSIMAFMEANYYEFTYKTGVPGGTVGSIIILGSGIFTFLVNKIIGKSII